MEVFFYISSWSKADIDPDPKYDADPYPETDADPDLAVDANPGDLEDSTEMVGMDPESDAYPYPENDVDPDPVTDPDPFLIIDCSDFSNVCDSKKRKKLVFYALWCPVSILYYCL